MLNPIVNIFFLNQALVKASIPQMCAEASTSSETPLAGDVIALKGNQDILHAETEMFFQKAEDCTPRESGWGYITFQPLTLLRKDVNFLKSVSSPSGVG